MYVLRFEGSNLQGENAGTKQNAVGPWVCFAWLENLIKSIKTGSEGTSSTNPTSTNAQESYPLILCIVLPEETGTRYALCISKILSHKLAFFVLFTLAVGYQLQL